MSQNIPCFTDIQTFINDFNIWVNGADNANVTLSGNFVMPSYRKFAKEELYRPGVNWSSTMTYLKDDIISFQNNIYVALSDNINKDPIANILVWRKIATGAIKEGIGISGFCSFLSNSKTLLTSKNLESFTYLGGSSFEIVVKDSIKDNTHLIHSFGYSYENFNLNNIRIGTAFIPTSRQILNDGKTLQFEINPSLINDLRIDICFYKVQ